MLSSTASTSMITLSRKECLWVPVKQPPALCNACVPCRVSPADWAPLQMGAEERENACAGGAVQGPRLICGSCRMSITVKSRPSLESDPAHTYLPRVTHTHTCTHTHTHHHHHLLPALLNPPSPRPHESQGT